MSYDAWSGSYRVLRVCGLHLSVSSMIVKCCWCLCLKPKRFTVWPFAEKLHRPLDHNRSLFLFLFFFLPSFVGETGSLFCGTSPIWGLTLLLCPLCFRNLSLGLIYRCAGSQLLGPCRRLEYLRMLPTPFLLLAATHGVGDLSFLTRDWTLAPCCGHAES